MRNDNKISRQYTFQIRNLIVMAFPKKKQRFGAIFLSAPNAPPSKTANLIFIVVSPSLNNNGN